MFINCDFVRKLFVRKIHANEGDLADESKKMTKSEKRKKGVVSKVMKSKTLEGIVWRVQ